MITVKSIITPTMIEYFEKILKLDKIDGYYLINSNLLNDKKNLESNYTKFCINKKLVCSYDATGLNKYNNDKKNHTLFNPCKYTTHLKLLFDVVSKFNNNLSVGSIKEDDLYYGRLYLNFEGKEEIFLETKNGYPTNNSAMTTVILMNWGYQEE